MSARVPTVPPTSHIKLDRWGTEFSQEHTPEVWEGRPVDVERLLDVVLQRAPFDVDVGIRELPAGVEGITEPPNRLWIPPEVYEGLSANPRARFTGTHEVVHAVRHLRYLNGRSYMSTTKPQLLRRDEIYPPSDPEWQANRGAAAILMPAEIVWQLISEHGFRPEPLMDRFGVSYTAARNRIRNALDGRLWAPTAEAQRLQLGLAQVGSNQSVRTGGR